VWTIVSEITRPVEAGTQTYTEDNSAQEHITVYVNFIVFILAEVHTL